MSIGNIYGLDEKPLPKQGFNVENQRWEKGLLKEKKLRWRYTTVVLVPLRFIPSLAA